MKLTKKQLKKLIESVITEGSSDDQVTNVQRGANALKADQGGVAKVMTSLKDVFVGKMLEYYPNNRPEIEKEANDLITQVSAAIRASVTKLKMELGKHK